MESKQRKKNESVVERARGCESGSQSLRECLRAKVNESEEVSEGLRKQETWNENEDDRAGILLGKADNIKKYKPILKR